MISLRSSASLAATTRLSLRCVSTNINKTLYRGYTSSNHNNNHNNNHKDAYAESRHLTLNCNRAQGTDYKQIANSFKWTIPEHFNIGSEICDKHLLHSRDRNAVVYEDEEGRIESITFGQLHSESNQLANALTSFGIARGDRVGVLLSQGIETALSHTTNFRIGAISIPLFTLFGPEALVYRLSNAEVSAVFTDYDNLPKLLQIKPSLPHLKKIIVYSRNKSATLSDPLLYQLSQYKDLVVVWENVRNNFTNKFTPVKTSAEDPALIIFTSGTTGNPKGCLHAHRVLIGHLPGVQLPQNFFPQEGKELCFYTPADWAWIGGLIDVLLPSLYYGVTVLAHRATKFSAERIANMMVRHRVTSCFLPPTALKMMRQATMPAMNQHILSVGSGGESLGDQLLAWGVKTFGTPINEFYGQTEANLLVGNCSKIMPVKNGSMGKAIPGHRVHIVDERGNELPVGQVGNIALRTPDPVVFLRYWNNDAATKSKYIGQWLVTGDLGRVDEDGYFWYVGRDDDIINSSGYRIGPCEIENCLLNHPAVAMAGVVGVPDELRGEVVKAYVVLRKEVQPSEKLRAEIQEFVKRNLAAHEYPRLLEFIDQLPMTTTGKIIRKDLREMHAKQQSSKK
uniref:medium-chain acyl-CoA ligase n=1 Tax=Rostrostelium ellipticum TaxID=361140 RepID=A0A1L2FUL0_9MYCE|nr:putative acetyl-CoA synthetase [Rostrostelium ellipticum]